MQDENERQWKKVNENTYDISSKKRVTKKFHVVVVVVENNGKEMYKIKCAARPKLFFANFHRSPVLPSPLSITRFYLLFEQTLNIIESFDFSPG